MAGGSSQGAAVAEEGAAVRGAVDAGAIGPGAGAPAAADRRAADAGSGGRIPSLDGLRGFSMLMVLFAHLAGTRNFFSLEVAHATGDLGNLGVRVFFVLSGFLITSLLFHEVKKTGTVSLKGFYLRRTFRIFPAFYVYLAIIVAARALGIIPLRVADAVHAATYTVNYAHGRSWAIGHIWSLSVEEQFYLLWPAAFLLLPGGDGKRRGAVGVAIAVILIAPLARIGIWTFLPAQRDLIGEAFPTIADSIAFGCLLAGVRGSLGERPGYMRFLRSRWFFVVPILAVVVNRFADHVRLFYVAGETLLDLLIAVTIDRAVRFPHGLFGRILNGKVISYIGMLSYSIYLWQQPFLNRASDAWPNRFPMNLLCAAAVGLLSYHLVEQPMLRLRVRLFEKPKAPAGEPAAAAPAARESAGR